MKFPKLTPKHITEASLSFTFTRRAMVLGGIQGGVGMLLAARMGWISVAENEKYTLLSESNRVNLTLVPPRRGWIIDRHGKPLAKNRTDFRVDIIPDRLRNKEAVIGTLERLLALAPEDVERIEEDLEKAAGFQPVQVSDQLSYEQFAAISVRLPDLPGVAPAQGYSRDYPAGPSVGHLLGYVGTASAKEYQERRDPLLITPGFKVGKDGLEQSFDRVLTGKPGAKRVEVTAAGKVVRELTTRSDTPGNTVKLTIDAGLQEYAGRRLGTESGSVVVMDCWTGDILTMASMPSFDPNSFSDGISQLEWDMLSEDDRVPLRNKTLQGLYPPGSTLKPMVAMALLEAGISPEERVNCPGGYQLGNRFFRCLGRHGSMNMHTAIARSCNTYFYSMSLRLGYDPIAVMAKSLGLGEKFDLPVASQNYGTVPDSAWKMRRFNQKWTQSDTLNAAIGQGYLILNPLQLGVMAACIASGKRIRPRLLMRNGESAPEPFPYDPAHFAIVRAAMSEVVNGHGTAGRSRLPFPDIMMGGKTGTAQVRRIAAGQRGGANVDRRYRDHGLFVFFAPVDRPRYAGSVVIEHGMGGSRAAAPVARDVLTYLFDPVKAYETLAELEQGWGGTPGERLEKQMEAFRISRGLAPPVDPAPDPTLHSEADNAAVNASLPANGTRE
tara:strand:+ start:40602 stop:42599 length:1998 start_codon:yes stop_codon:yes gene_type:complete